MKTSVLLAVSALLLLPAFAAAQDQNYKSIYDQIYAPPPGGGGQQYQQPNPYQQQQKSTYDMIYDQAVGGQGGNIDQYDASQVPTLDVDTMYPPTPSSEYCGPPQCTVAPEDMNAQTPLDPCAPVLGMATDYDCLPPGSFERDLQRGY